MYNYHSCRNNDLLAYIDTIKNDTFVDFCFYTETIKKIKIIKMFTINLLIFVPTYK